MVPVIVTHQIQTKHYLDRISVLLFIVGSRIKIRVLALSVPTAFGLDNIIRVESQNFAGIK